MSDVPPPPPPPGGGYPGMPPVQSQLVPAPESRYLYPAAPATLKQAVLAEMAGTGKPVRGWNWYFGDALLMFGAWFVFAVVAVSLVGTDDTGWALVVLQLLPWLGLAGVPCLLAWTLGNGPRIDLGIRWKWSDLWWGIGYGFLSLVVASILGVITTQIFGDFSSAAGEVGAGLSDNKPLLVIFVLMIAVGAPIVEEIAFRGQVFNSIAKFKVWPILTVLLSAVIFSLFHFETVRILLLLGVGIVLGLARWHTGSLTTAIIAHMCNNLPGALYLLFL